MATPVSRPTTARSGMASAAAELRRAPAPAVLAIAALVGLAAPPPAAATVTMAWCGDGSAPGDLPRSRDVGCHSACAVPRDEDDDDGGGPPG